MTKVYSFSITVVFLFVFSALKAQGDQDYVRSQPNNSTYTSEDKKFSLSFSVGEAMPYGDFASTNVAGSFWDFNSIDSTRLQGFAKPGLHFNFKLNYFISDYFGLTVMLGGNSNKFDLNAFSHTMGYKATASTTSYFTGEYMLGAVFSFPFNKHWKLNASLLGGLAKNNYPELTLAINDTITYTRSLNNGSLSLAYCIDAGIVYDASSTIDLLAGISYTGTTLHYSGWTETEEANSTHPNSYYFIPYIVYHSNGKTSMVTGLLKPYIGIALKF